MVMIRVPLIQPRKQILFDISNKILEQSEYVVNENHKSDVIFYL